MNALVGAAKRAAKVAVCHVLYYTGVLQLWQRVAMRQRAVVLMYHRVLSTEERQCTGSHPALIVDSATFEQHMRLLKRRFRVLTLAEFSRCMEERTPFPDSACLITFDDGWQDNVINALPILERHRLPALIFLPFSFIGTERLFWPEALTNVLVEAVEAVHADPARRPAITALLAPHGLAPILDLPPEGCRAAVVRAARTGPPRVRTEMETLIEALRRALGSDARGMAVATALDRFMTWSQVTDMARRGISFGGHGMDHHLLTRVPTEVMRAEIHESRAAFDAHAISDVPTFSYPNGYWTEPIRQEVDAAGYRLGFGTRRGFVSCDDDRLTIHRLNVHEGMTGSGPMFLARIVGLL